MKIVSTIISSFIVLSITYAVIFGACYFAQNIPIWISCIIAIIAIPSAHSIAKGISKSYIKAYFFDFSYKNRIYNKIILVSFLLISGISTMTLAHFFDYDSKITPLVFILIIGDIVIESIVLFLSNTVKSKR